MNKLDKIKKNKEKQITKNIENIEKTEKLFKDWLNIKRELFPKNNQLPNYDDFIFNPDWLKYVQITTRGDGKTPSHLSALLALSVLSYGKKYSNPFISCIVVRHDTLKTSIVQGVVEYWDELVLPIDFEQDDLIVINNIHYFEICHKTYGLLMIVTDLTDATDLKNYSNLLRKISVFYFDEFLALESDYDKNEALNFNTIWRSSAKENDLHRFLETPKIVLAGNPINLSSPLIPAFRLANPISELNLNEKKYFDTIRTFLEIRMNNDVILSGVSDMFYNEGENGANGDFNFNKFNVVQNNFRYVVNVSINEYVVHIHFNPDSLEYAIEIDKDIENVTHTFNVSDINENIEFLRLDRFFRQRYLDKFEKRNVKFTNNYTKSIVLNDTDLMGLNYKKIIKYCGYDLYYSNKKTYIDKAVKIEQSKKFEKSFMNKFNR